MLSIFWPKKRDDLKLQAQEAILSSALDEVKALSSELLEVKEKLEAKANGALVRLRGLEPNGEIKLK